MVRKRWKKALKLLPSFYHYLMDNLKSESLDWALTHIRRYGDTDLFPVPFEYEAITHSWASLRSEIEKIDIATYEGRPLRRFLIPKQYIGYRIAIQLDPIDTIIYTALAYEAAEQVEKYRVPIERKIACSYRVELGAKGELFRKNNGWDEFHSKSLELASSGHFSFVLTADIAEFYNQIGHHRIRNALELAGIDKDRSKNIENFLMNLTRGQSRGIPIGPAGSIIFSEACLGDVDNFLLRKGYVHTRYVDDFRIFCTDVHVALKALHDLTEYLYTSHRLTLQTHKCNIFGVDDFVKQEMIDPSEIEEYSKEEKLKAISDFFADYSNFDEDDLPDLDQVIRDNLVDLFLASLANEPTHLGMIKYLLRRATSLRTGVLREAVLENIGKLSPVIREVSQYIVATTKEEYSKSIGERFKRGCEAAEYSFLPYIHYWLVEVFLKKMSTSMESELADICNLHKPSLGVRPFALLAKKNRYTDWVREQKETWQNNNPWDKRAIIWAGQALSVDEMNYWLKRVQNAGDILDRSIAEAALHLGNK
jgi:hypothetical protein